MQPHRFRSFFLGVCVLLFTANILGARAEITFNCDKLWDKPDAQNDVQKCLRKFVDMRDNVSYFIIPIIFIAFTVLLIIVVPIAFIFNRLCCEDYCFKFTHTTNLVRSRCWLWMLISINFFWSIFSAILIVYGASLLSDALKKSIAYIRGDALDYFLSTKKTIIDLLTDYRDPSHPIPPTVNLDGFDTLTNVLAAGVDSIRSNYFIYLEYVRTASLSIGVVGILLMISCIIIAYCRFNTLGAFTFGIIYYVFAIIYAVMSIVLSLFTCVMFAFCGEITLHNRREPGVFQWYLVPWCRNRFSLEKSRDEIKTNCTVEAGKICNDVSSMCSEKDDVDITKPFLCPDNRPCDTLERAVDRIYSVKAKTKLADLMCVNTTNWKYQEECDIPHCVSACVDYEYPQLKAQSLAKNAMNFLTYSVNKTSAMSYVLPVMDCNFIIDKFISVYQTSKKAANATEGYGLYCSNIRVASTMLTVGFFTGAIMFVMSIYVTQQGVWMWSDEAEVEDIKEAEAMSKYAKSIASVDPRSQMGSRMNSFVLDPRASASGRGILAGPTRSFNQMPSMHP